MSFFGYTWDEFSSDIDALIDDPVEFLTDPIQDFIMPDVVMPDTSATATTLADSDASRSILINTANSVAKIPVVYGKRRVGGNRVFRQVSDDGTQIRKYLWLVLEISEGEILQYIDIYLDGVSIYEAVWGTSLSVYTYSGATAQAAPPELIAAFPGVWTANHKLSGVAYKVLRLTANPDVYSKVPVITADINGKKCLDVRDSIVKYTNNPALCIYDYLTNAIYGKGLATSLLDTQSFIDAANYCDTTITEYTSGPLIKIFECNGVVDTGRSIKENLELLLTSCRGYLVFSGGKYKLGIEKDSASVYAFTSDNIISGISVQSGSKRSRLNRCKAGYTDPLKNWSASLAISESTALRAIDNNLLLESEINFPFETNYYRALYHAEVAVKKSRQGLQASFVASPGALVVEVGDIVTITHTGLGWSAKKFRVTSITLRVDGLVPVSVIEHEPTVYDRTVPVAAATPPDTTLPDPRTVIAPTGLTLASGDAHLLIANDGTIISRIYATFTASTDQYVVGYEVDYKLNSASAWVIGARLSSIAEVATYLAPVRDGVGYDVRVRAVNSLGYFSPYITVSNHSVIGKLALPSNVTGFIAAQNGSVAVFRWDAVLDKDFSGVEIRYGAPGIAWDNAYPLTKVTRGTNITSGDIPPGSWECLIKARDTSFNYSATEARDTLNFINTSTIVHTKVHNPDWLDAKLYLVKHWTGKLLPHDGNAVAAYPNYEPFNIFCPVPVGYGEYVTNEIDLGADITARLWATMGSEVAPGSAEGANRPLLYIDYRTSSGSYGGFVPWSVGNVTARYVKFMVALYTASNKLIITGLTVTVDATPRKESGSNVAISSGGTAITFATPFANPPLVDPKYYGSTLVTPVADSVTTTGFTARLFNSSGVAISGTLSKWEATGV